MELIKKQDDMGKIYPVGIQNFEKLRKEGYYYVDKTELVYKLVKTGQYYFLSRPRRFGKSLLVSTLDAYFKGRKELFAGLAMEGLEQDWAEHPVLHLDLNAQKYEAPEHLDNILNDALCKWEKLYGSSPSETSLSLRFQGVVQRAAEQSGRNVVVLVDEYDKPMLQAIGNEALQAEYRSTLKAFYGVLKSCDQYLRFALLTGVTKFSKVSIFSDLNNLSDISMSPRFANICGVTEEELRRDFQEDIRELGKANGMTAEEAARSLKEWFDGYHFTEDSEDIYNPFSLLKTFSEKRFGSYWFETGTPTFLVEVLKRNKYDLHRLTEEMATADSLAGIDTMERDPVPLLYQSGYLTIKGFNKTRCRSFTRAVTSQSRDSTSVSVIIRWDSRTRRWRKGLPVSCCLFMPTWRSRVPFSKSPVLWMRWRAATSRVSCVGCRVSLRTRPTSWRGIWSCITRTCCSSCSSCWAFTRGRNTTLRKVGWTSWCRRTSIFT